MIYLPARRERWTATMARTKRLSSPPEKTLSAFPALTSKDCEPQRPHASPLRAATATAPRFLPIGGYRRGKPAVPDPLRGYFSHPSPAPRASLPRSSPVNISLFALRVMCVDHENAHVTHFKPHSPRRGAGQPRAEARHQWCADDSLHQSAALTSRPNIARCDRLQ